MLPKLKLLFVLFVIGQSSFAQQTLPVIKANSITVDIRDGNVLNKDTWSISPKIKPDVYETANKNKKVTFYTDLDSISFIVKPNKKYNFIILLNNKDSALTQIIYNPNKSVTSNEKDNKMRYINILKNAAKYNLNDNRLITKFTYESMKDSSLIEIRKAFNLDSIIGTGNEISQIINLLHWVHNTRKTRKSTDFLEETYNQIIRPLA